MSNASRSRLIFAAAMIVAAYFIYTAAEGALRAHSVSQNRNQAEDRVAQLEAKKSYLEAVKEYVGSDSYVEQEARRRLGYTRDGEVRSSSSAPRRAKTSKPPASGGSGSSRADAQLTTALIEQVADLAERERMFRGSRKVLAAVSGGTDSVALLLVLLRLRERFGFELVASHFDHHLRADSHEDMEWVRSLCKTLEVPCFTGEGDVSEAARGTTASRMRPGG
jgi:cell division protein FtsB